MKNFKTYLTLFFLLYFLGGCNPAKKNWEKAVQQNTVAGYKEYLQRYPDSEFAKEAAHRYDSLDWVQSIISPDSLKMTQYLVNHPAGNYVENAKLILDSLEWGKAISSRDTARINALITKNPESQFREKGEAVIWEIEWPPVRFAKNGSVVIYSQKYGNVGIISGNILQSSPFYGSMGPLSAVEAHLGKILTEKGIRSFCNQEFMPGQPAIFIWRDFTRVEKEYANKLGITKGVAYQIDCNNNYKAIRVVDLSKTDKQLFEEFGINNTLIHFTKPRI